MKPEFVSSFFRCLRKRVGSTVSTPTHVLHALLWVCQREDVEGQCAELLPRRLHLIS